jgi:tRNA pseudouridine55 synthase
MDGLINLYKPTGLTSAKALYRARKITGVRKSGHAGTLDPAAEGVLLLCLGKGTKLVERLMDQPKVYRATARLDVTSASYDSEGPLEAVSVATVPDERHVREALAGLTGEIEQVPPAISALKVGGRPAYKLSRTGRAPELAARVVRVYWLHLWRYAWPEVDFELACGRGTYVRALIRDVGERLGTGGCLTGLVRRAVGPFRVDDAWTLERLAAVKGQAYLVSLSEVGDLLSGVAVPPAPK